MRTRFIQKRFITGVFVSEDLVTIKFIEKHLSQFYLFQNIS